MSKGTSCPQQSCKGELTTVRLPIELDVDVLRQVLGTKKPNISVDFLPSDDEQIFDFEQLSSGKKPVEMHTTQRAPKKEARVHLHPAVAGVDILACNVCGTAVIPAAIKIKPDTL